MIFNSWDFLLFIVIFFFLYWFLFNKELKRQNLLLLIGSYFFYAWWDWRFSFLLLFISLSSYFVALYINKATSDKCRALVFRLGLLIGFSGLFYFKYYNFFIDSFIIFLNSLDISFSLNTVNLILPLGISFYTFRTISYMLDVENETIQPTKDIVVYLNYVAFFPTLLSGPIDKARDFLPQLEVRREFNYNSAVNGFRQILWGLFKKIVIADNLSIYVNQIFEGYGTFSGLTLILGAFFYIIQLYCDFSGYSDMAIGVSKLLGFKVTRNFNFPFFSNSIADFWRRWHISLTSWVTEYVYTPLSFMLRNRGRIGLFLAILTNFILIGVWHGANMIFIVFGVVQGLLFLPQIFKNSLVTEISKKGTSNALRTISVILTFFIMTIVFVLLRATSLGHALSYYKSIIYNDMFSGFVLDLKKISVGADIVYISIIVLLFFTAEWLQRFKEYTLEISHISKIGLRWSIYYFICVLILWYSDSKSIYIYFQF